MKEARSVAVVGLGYVGLPLAVAMAKHFSTIGFDINAPRVSELLDGQDSTGEVNNTELKNTSAVFTSDPEKLGTVDVIIVAVPTPIDSHRTPDLSPLASASRTVGEHMRRGCVVVFESTVYPGVTEEFCVPILEQHSGMVFGKDFAVGYSPERINPGDKVHTLETIKKVVSGSDEATCDMLAAMYGTVVTAGIHKAPAIKVAEAAKVIENTQRDINIALMNELALIFSKMDIDTRAVLDAAGTKWNFLPFTPGLVGGHCIGVDPYYLTYKAQELGYHPEVILAGRRINDSMGKVVAEQCVKQLIKRGGAVAGARVGILGLTFKEDVPDLRNTRVVDIIHELEEYGVSPLVHDPMADSAEAKTEYGLSLVSFEELRDLDAMLLTVAHSQFRCLTPATLALCFKNDSQKLVLDVKSFWKKSEMHALGYTYWQL